MARMGQAVQKPKNMKQALGKLAGYCKKEFVIIIIALILATVGTVLTIIGPDQISKITDYIYDGLTGGISTEEIAGDVQKQIASGELDILEYLPEGTDPKTVDLSSIDLTDKDDPLSAAILDNVRLSDEFAQAHKDGGIDMDGILSVCILLIVIYLISAICNFSQHFIMATVTQKVSRRMRSDISKKINRLPLKYFSSNSYGDVLSRVTNDVDTIGQGLSNSAANIVSASAQFIGCLIMMFWTDWIMAVTTIITTVLGIFFMAFIMKHSQRYFKQRQESLGKLNGYIEEMYSGHNVIRISNAEKKIKSRFNDLNLAVKNANFKSQFLSGLMQPVMNFVGNLGYVAVCIVGAMLVINGNIRFGVITAFLIYVRLFEQPLKQIAQGMTNMQSTAAATERVFEFMEEEELENEDHIIRTKNDIVGEVDFEDVHFAYPDTPDKEVIHGFSAHIRSGQKVAIVGPTGAGKTTLVNLLMRFFETTSGDIKIDGVSVKELRRENVHSMFGMVLQETWLFEGTVRENLVYNCENVSDETMINACKACGIHNFIKALPQGYDTVLNDNTSISAGQKQLFTIARAMIQDSPMLILDEATSSVDTRTEVIIQKAMDKLTENRTSFVIAHRLSTIKNADVILVVKDGDIIEQGSHEQLLEKGGFYAELYKSQFETTA